MIPGIFAVLVSIFILFVSMYGFKGAQFNSGSTGPKVYHGREAAEKMLDQARRKMMEDLAKKDTTEMTREELKSQISKAFKDGDRIWDQAHPEDATQDYEPIVAVKEKGV